MHLATLQNNNARVVTFWVLVSVFVVAFFAYIYFVNDAIMNVVDRKQAEAASRDIAARISELEAEYYALRSEITPEYAQSLGFEESGRTVFAARNTYAGLAQLDTR